MTTAADPRTLLRSRAVALAKRPVEVERRPMLDLLVATVEGRTLAFESGHVVQILPNRGLCHLPGECGELLGLVAARGALVPVADLGSLLAGVPPNRDRDFIVLLESDAPALGVLVDDVAAVLRLPVQDVRPRPSAATTSSLERGITPSGEVVLDIHQLLADPRLSPATGQDRTQETGTPRPDQTPGEPCPT